MPVVLVVFFIILRTLPSLVVGGTLKYLPEDGQELTETCRRIIRTFKQYNFFNVLFLIK